VRTWKADDEGKRDKEMRRREIEKEEGRKKKASPLEIAFGNGKPILMTLMLEIGGAT